MGSMSGPGRTGTCLVLVGAAALLLLTVPSAHAQSLADFDYEDLSFRGLSVETGYILPSRVEPTTTLGTRADLGYLGPGVRVVTGLSYWSSFLERAEVERLENRLAELIREQSDGSAEDVSVELGRIRWSDVAFSVDGHMVWGTPFGVLTFAGLGATAHVMRGGGAAIEGTFVEDLLDSVRAGVNIHGGVEFPVHRYFRLYGLTRFEVLEDLNYMEFRVGGQLTWGAPAPGEMRGG